MTTSTAIEIPEESDEVPLLDNSAVVHGGVLDYKGRPADRFKSGRWTSALFLIGVELAERFAHSGISSNLISYLAGPLGLSKATAAENVNTWTGVTTVLPLLGAFIADSYLGRYQTILISSVLYVLGLGLMTLSAVLLSQLFRQ